MPDMRQAFPSKYMKADDLAGRPMPVQISHVNFENVAPENKAPETKPVLYFLGREQGLVLNQTNNGTLCLMLGNESDMWCNQYIELIPDITQFGGKAVPCIRMRGVTQQGAPQAAPPWPGSQPVNTAGTPPAQQAGFGTPPNPAPHATAAPPAQPVNGPVPQGPSQPAGQAYSEEDIPVR